VRTIRPHTHAERVALLPDVVRRLEDRFGDGLLSVAVAGSFARGDDGPYSDIDVVAIIAPDGPRADEPGTVEIVDGQFVDIPYWTVDDLLRPLREPRNDWCFWATRRLVAVTNPPIVEQVERESAALIARARRQGDPLHERLVALATGRLSYEVPEHVGKLLNACQPGRLDAERSLLLPRALHELLVTVALLNARPYPDLVAMLDDAPRLPIRPPGLEELCALCRTRDADAAALATVFLTVVAGLEALLLRPG
jgi:kanamycin nucleotidyltransferase